MPRSQHTGVCSTKGKKGINQILRAIRSWDTRKYHQGLTGLAAATVRVSSCPLQQDLSWGHVGMHAAKACGIRSCAINKLFKLLLLFDPWYFVVVMCMRPEAPCLV